VLLAFGADIAFAFALVFGRCDVLNLVFSIFVTAFAFGVCYFLAVATVAGRAAPSNAGVSQFNGEADDELS
jgi:hypothetical protein